MAEKYSNKAYSDAGVNLDAGYESVERIKKHINRTRRPEVLSNIGGFGGLFRAQFSDLEEPILVSGTDGVGTKLKLAFLLDKHDTIGQDCVAMCVNDIVCAGAEPLFFLDYIACGKNYPQKIEQIVKGISDGLEQANCALIGGETAEMPGFYPEDEYDLAGFAVGVVDKKKMLDGKNMAAGNRLIALPSSGVHSNGFSLVRKIFSLDSADKTAVIETLNQEIPNLGKRLGLALLEPTKIYVKPVMDLMANCEVLGISHITGGGFYENLPRMLPDDKALSICIKKDAIKVLPLFDYIQEKGKISEHDMFATFNMGVGMVIVVEESELVAALSILEPYGAYEIGYLIEQSDKKEDDIIQWI